MVSCMLFAGCVNVDVGGSAPSVSVNYSRSEQNGRVTISATLTGFQGLDGWQDLSVTGCRAPSEGEIVVPHKFAGCTGDLSIAHKPSGDVLYSSA